MMSPKHKRDNHQDISSSMRYPLILLQACQKGDLRFIKSILRNHFYYVDNRLDLLDVDVLLVSDPNGAGIFHYAARGDQTPVLRFFWPLIKDQTFPKTCFLSTPAHDAAALGSLKSLQWLVKRGRYLLLEKDLDGCNVLHLAAR